MEEQQNYLNTEKTGFQGKIMSTYTKRWLRYQEERSPQITEVYEHQGQKNKPSAIKNVAMMNERNREKKIIAE